MLSSNLLKGSWVQIQTDETRMINSNVVIEKRLRQGDQGGFVRRTQEEYPDVEVNEGFQSGLNAEELGALLTDEEESPAVIKAEAPQPVYTGPSPEELIAQAEAEIAQAREEFAQMQAQAQAEIEAARKQAVEKGREEGRQQGYRDGSAQAEKELADAKRKLEADYQEQIRNLEPEFIKQLSGIYEHIFRVDLGSYHNLVTGLLENCMQKIESSSTYIVHVSREDYPYVSMQKKVLSDAVGNKNAVLEVVEDVSMRKNECMIEADSGIYDCSLDMQLEALRRELMLLSYEGAE